MRIGQTSIIVFFAKIIASAVGFVGTVYFSRELGPDIIGIYATVVALITWLQFGGKIGIHTAITKRLSEEEHRGEYFAAGVIMIFSATAVISLVLIFFGSYIESYVSKFSTYSDTSIVWFIIILLFPQVAYHIVNATLQGQHLAHIVGLLRPVRTGFINGTQFVLVFFFGFSLLGLILGHVAGILLAALIGSMFISIQIRQPDRQHFARIYEYARYSWSSSLSNRTFSSADIIILGAFVPSSLVGIYSVAWMLSSSLNLFAGSISSAIFPEISSVASKENLDAATGMIEDTIAYAGLVVIPGLVGGLLLNDRLFRIYGSGFGGGTQVLPFLLVSILAYSYLGQFSTALNGLDRPDLVLRVNTVFILTNIILNVALIQLVGWTGAALASAVSTSFGAFLSWYYLSRIITLKLPVASIGKQTVAAGGMGVVVWLFQIFISSLNILNHNTATVGILVGVGALTYALLLLVISKNFRTTIIRNLPFNLIKDYDVN
jgi:O-antigen/teichoic acid export membrane protein